MEDFIDIVNAKTLGFGEDTLVITENGKIKITDIKAGDLVLSQNTSSGEQGFKKVLTTHVADVTNARWMQYDLPWSGGYDSLLTTCNQTIWTDSNGWKRVGTVQNKHLLWLDDGCYAKFHFIDEKERQAQIHNLCVADWGTFYVLGFHEFPGILVGDVASTERFVIHEDSIPTSGHDLSRPELDLSTLKEPINIAISEDDISLIGKFLYEKWKGE